MGWQHIMAIFANTPEVSHVAWCVLEVLAKLADGRGESWPSVAYLVEKTKLSVRSVQRGIKELVEARLVEVTSGQGTQTVNHYRLTDRVINLSTGVPHSHPRGCHTDTTGVPHSHPGGCHTDTTGVPHSHQGGATVAHGSKQEKITKKQSQLQCPPPPDKRAAVRANSAEELLARGGAGRLETPPLAAGNERQRNAAQAGTSGTGETRDYRKLVKEYGWKPSGRRDVEAAVDCCYNLGASVEEAKSFARYNNLRRWSAICETVSVYQLAKEWIRRWRWKTPCEWEQESERRREEKRRREEEKMRAAIAAEARNDAAGDNAPAPQD